jgi:hypothetical protein
MRRGYFLLIAALVVLGVAIAGCSGPSEEAPEAARPTEPPPAVTKAPEPTAPPAPTDTPVPTVAPSATPEPQGQYLGDVVEGHGALLAAISMEDPTTPGRLYSPEAGQKLVAVQVVVGSSSRDAMSVNPLNATLLDSEGFVYQAELGGRDGQISTVHLSVGEKVRGWIAFEVPEGASPAALKYEVEFFGNKVLQVGLAAPPEGYVPDTAALAQLPTAPSSGLGDTVEQHGYSLSAESLEDPTTPGRFYTAMPGMKVVAVQIVVGNVSGEQLSINPLNAILVDSHGYVYEAELGGRDDGQIDVADLDPGEKARGWVAFSIPEGETPTSVKYQVDFFEGTFLYTGLGQ